MRRKMMKEDSGVSSAQAWGCPHAPQGISKETQESKLGDSVLEMDQAYRPGIRNLWADLHVKAHKEDPARSLTCQE